MSNGDSETDQETSSYEHLNIDTNRLKSNSDNHDDTTGDDTSTSASNISDVWSNR
jgi:hypothetical protein